MRPNWAKVFKLAAAAFVALLMAGPRPAAAVDDGRPASLQILDRYGYSLRTVLSLEQTLHQPVALEAVSPWMVLATLAAEDRRFFSHPGVDVAALARALWQDARAGRAVSGGSTISEQLVRALTPRPRTLAGKLAEALDALRLERRLDKRSILEGYLNNVSYGGRLRGVQAAAWSYFGVPARDLSLAQAALLAGIPKSPRSYDPRRHPEQALSRQRRVLGRMKEWGWLDARDVAFALGERTSIQGEDRRLRAAHFTEFVRAQAAGPLLRTTLDAGLQESCESLLREHLARLARYRVNNGAIVALDNATGEVLAWVGSADYFDADHHGAVDGVTSLRQPGSALKPFAYGLAFSRGLKASDILQDTPAYFPGGFTPRNYDETFHGPVCVREALACSYNIPAVRVAQRLGVSRLLDGLKGFGLTELRESPEHYGLGLALGNGEVSLLGLTNAYAALARGGVWMPWSALRQGPRAAARRALDRESAYIVTDILCDNSARASAFGLNSPFHVPFPFAAKTGTTKDYRDNWAVGYTPGWTVGVWVGNFDGQPMRRVSGISGAGPLLHDVAQEMERRFGSRAFSRPAGIREIEVCPDSGRLPGPWCPSRVREVFSVRSPPGQVCAAHGPLQPSVADRPARLVVEFPKAGDVFELDPTAPSGSQVMRLKAAGVDESVRWTLDGRELPQRGPSVWWALAAGRHRLFLFDDRRQLRSPTVQFLVLP